MALSPALLALVKQSKNKHTRAGNSVQLKEGKTKIRVLPNKDGSQFWADLGVHWIKTVPNGKPVAVVGCHDEVYGQPCPICTAIQQATAAATSDEEVALIKEWKANKTVLVNAIVRDGANASADPQVVELKSSVWGQVLGMITEYADAGVDLLDCVTGQDFVVERRGRGQNDTKYTVMLAPKSDKIDPSVLDRVHDLRQWIESQFFRGDETKALTAIANVTGITIGASHQLTGPATNRAGLLNKSAAVVEDAEVAAVAEALVEAEAEETVIEEVVEETKAETDEERELREFREFKAAQAAKAAAAAKTDDSAAKAAALAKAKAAAEAKAKFEAEKKAAAEFAAKKKAAAESVVQKPADEFNSSLPADEIDSLLAELDS